MFSNIPPVHHYRVELLTEHYILTGELEPFGPLMTYLNDASRVALRLKSMEAKSLDPSLALDNFHADEMMVRKDEIVINKAHIRFYQGVPAPPQTPSAS